MWPETGRPTPSAGRGGCATSVGSSSSSRRGSATCTIIVISVVCRSALLQTAASAHVHAPLALPLAALPAAAVPTSPCANLTQARVQNALPPGLECLCHHSVLLCMRAAPVSSAPQHLTQLAVTSLALGHSGQERCATVHAVALCMMTSPAQGLLGGCCSTVPCISARHTTCSIHSCFCL